MDLVDTFSWTNKKIKVIDTHEYGMGVFATENISKGETIAIFGGYIMSIDDEQALPESIRDNAVQIGEDIVLGIKKEAEIEIACYFNHSCDPNSGFNGQNYLVAMNDIEKGEHITFDYAMVLFRASNGIDYSFDCMCKKNNCRKKVTNSDWKIEELQKRYGGFFQYYLEEKIKKIK